MLNRHVLYIGRTANKPQLAKTLLPIQDSTDDVSLKCWHLHLVTLSNIHTVNLNQPQTCHCGSKTLHVKPSHRDLKGAAKSQTVCFLVITGMQSCWNYYMNSAANSTPQIDEKVYIARKRSSIGLIWFEDKHTGTGDWLCW